MNRLCYSITVAALVAAIVPAARADTTVIGGFAEVANSVTGALPGQQQAPKAVKAPAHFGETVLTQAKAKANISFIDGSHVLIGENAALTIDAFVFDPKSGKEKAVYNIAAGALRFVSGAIKSDSIKIQTPTAAIVVRGTNFKLRVQPDGTTVVSVNSGAVEVTSRRTFATATLGPGQSVSASDQGLGGVDASEVEVADEFVDDVALDGDPDLAEVDLSDLGFSDEQANEIESAVSEAESESGDTDSAGGDSEGGAGGDSGDSRDSGGDSGSDGGGDGGGGGGSD